MGLWSGLRACCGKESMAMNDLGLWAILVLVVKLDKAMIGMCAVHKPYSR